MPDSTLAAPLETVPALDRRFHVSGIPTVVLLDGQTGEVIVKDCVTNVIRDPEGRQFPWRTKTVWETLEGEDIVKKDDEGNWFPVNKAELQDKELVFLLFAAEWWDCSNSWPFAQS